MPPCLPFENAVQQAILSTYAQHFPGEPMPNVNSLGYFLIDMGNNLYAIESAIEALESHAARIESDTEQNDPLLMKPDNAPDSVIQIHALEFIGEMSTAVGQLACKTPPDSGFFDEIARVRHFLTGHGCQDRQADRRAAAFDERDHRGKTFLSALLGASANVAKRRATDATSHTPDWEATTDWIYELHPKSQDFRQRLATFSEMSSEEVNTQSIDRPMLLYRVVNLAHEILSDQKIHARNVALSIAMWGEDIT